MSLHHLLAFTTVLLLPLPSAVHAADYEFDGKISRGVLENYLSRSITMLDLLTGHGNVDDNIRMLKNIGAKFAGRTIYLWGQENQLLTRLAAARQNAPKIHAADPQMILQACVFEIVSEDVDKLPIPAWAFEAFGQSVEKRNFRYENMLYPGGRGHNHWRQGSSIPDISQQETKLWFYFLAASYIDVGCEAIHFGQAEIMDGNDPNHRHWRELLGKVREYAARHARRHLVLTVADEGDWLVIRFGPLPLFRKRIRYDDIIGVEIGRTTIMDGWGIHWSPWGGWVWSLSAGTCVVIRRRRGVIKVGTDDAEGLAEFLNGRIRCVEGEQ